MEDWERKGERVKGREGEVTRGRKGEGAKGNSLRALRYPLRALRLMLQRGETSDKTVGRRMEGWEIGRLEVKG